ncbi:MAG TPA: MMPL family transporter [Solirubrobacteraceae bacterium]|nr:MMPL family transporter [Solirubrobacteraceae bacterium]
MAVLTNIGAGRPRRTLALALLVVVAAAAVAAPVAGSLQPFSSEDPGSPSVAARRAIERATGVDPYFNMVALVPTPRGIAGAGARAAVARVERAMRAQPAVALVQSFYTSHDNAMLARDGRATFVLGELRAVSTTSQLAAAHRVERALSAQRGVRLGGLAAFYSQGNELARKDLITAELFAFPLLLLAALWVFRGLVAACLPLLVGAVTIVGTLAALRVISELTSVSIYALNLATALGLGLAVDYGLLIVSRYREEIARSGPGRAALERTLASAGRTVAMSSLTIAAVLSSLLVFPQAFLRSVGLGGIFVALIAGASALLVLPAVLTLLRWRVNAGTLTRWRRAAYAGARPSADSRWYRLSRTVMRRPVRVALVSGAVLLAFGAPALGLRVTQIDANVMPRGSAARSVHEAIERDFPKADGAPLLIAASAPTGAAAQTYAARLRGLRDIAAIRGPLALGRGEWELEVVPASAPLSSASERLVGAVRALHEPFRVLVGGESAAFVDLKHSLSAHLPLALVLLIAFTAIAVFLITGSVVLPLKALLMNALTIAAVLGALVFVFQDGRLQGALAYTSSGALEPSTLVLIFAVSCGLATDYGIFLLSRIREARDAGATDGEAVALGLERTGRIVTAAALLLCIALGSLMTASHALVKEVGFGGGLAVAIDATLVRGMLLPSLMRLLGPLNWYCPAWLRRLARAPGAAPGPRRPPAPVGSAPSLGRPASEAECLARTRFCDHDSPEIRACLEELLDQHAGDGQTGVAVAAFELVRDRVLYAFGAWSVPASRTLARQAGTCTNKANLLVALLRAAGIPAAYGVMRVDARRYFGAIGPSFLTRYASPESLHVYCAARLRGRWVKCDPSTDSDLACRTEGFCQQTRLIRWDGAHDSLDFLDPRHVFADLGLYADIDELIARPARSATPSRLKLANDYLEFIRGEPAFESEHALVRAYLTAGRLGEADGVLGRVRAVALR